MRHFCGRKIFTVLFLMFFVISCGGQETGKSEKKEDTQISFELTSLKDGKEYTFESFIGKPTVLNFWASWCVPCREEMPFLQQTWEKKKKAKINIVGINVMDSQEEALGVLEEFDITYTNLFDRNGDLSSELGVLGLPATVFIDKNGNIVKKYFGPFLGEEGKENFNNLLGEIL